MVLPLSSNEKSERGQQKLQINVLVLGAGHVGKSDDLVIITPWELAVRKLAAVFPYNGYTSTKSLTVRFLTRRFIGEYGDIETVYTHNVTVDGREICFNIWDSLYSQNSKGTSHASEQQMCWADGFIFVYSICDRASFNVARQQVQRLRQVKGGRAPALIVGNKRDLRHRRAVSGEEGRLLALASRCGFLEVSAAETYHGVLVAFHQLLGLVRESKAAAKKAAGLRGIVRSVSAVFGKRRAE